MSQVNVSWVRRTKLRLMVSEINRDYTQSHELGVVYPTKVELSTDDGTYTVHAPLQAWYEAIDPPKKKEVTTEEALLAAVNTSIWLPIMAWRDWLIEIDAREDVIFGLTWLIDHKKFPEEGRFDSENLSVIAYRWLIKTTQHNGPTYLPPAVREDFQRNVYEGYHVKLVPRVFKTIHEAFWTAAISIAKHREDMVLGTETDFTYEGAEDE